MAVIKINQNDFLFFAMESVVPSQGLLSSYRFNRSLPANDVKAGFRHLLRIYPKLRSIIEPTLFSYRYRILADDDPRLATLFEDAFKVGQLPPDASEFSRIRRNLLNEPFALEQGLPFKSRYLSGKDESILLLSTHHMITDGYGLLHMMNAFMAYLHGDSSIEEVRDDASFLRELLPKPRYTVPLQIARSYLATRRMVAGSRQGRIVSASERPVDYFGPVDMITHTSPYDLSALKQAAVFFDCTVTILILAALSRTLGQRRAASGDDTIAIALPMDMRRYLQSAPHIVGNYITAPLLKVPAELCNHPAVLIDHLKNELSRQRDFIERNDILYTLVISKIMSLFGKKIFAWGARIAKARGALAKTCMLSNVGSLDQLNRHGTRFRLTEAAFTTASHSLFMCMSTIDNRIHSAFSYQEAEFTHDEVQALIAAFDDALRDIITGQEALIRADNA